LPQREMAVEISDIGAHPTFFFDARGGSWSLVITQNSNANQPTISFYGFLALRFCRRIVLGFFSESYDC